MRIGLTLGIITAALFTGSLALAHGDEPEHKSEPTTEPAHDGPGEEKKEGKEEKEEEEASWELSGDVVVGLATTDVLNAGPPGRREATPENSFDSSRITTVSTLLGIEHEITKRIVVGARMPFMEGGIASRTGALPSRNGIVIPGNLEFGGTYKLPVSKYTLELTLELALPTGSGVDQPSREEVEKDPTKTYEYNRLDKAAVMRAASWSRGQLDSGLFEPGRIGVTPKVSMPLTFGKLTVRPMLKVENLFDVTGDAGQSYVGELIVAANVSYRVHKYVEPGLYTWANILYTTAEISDPSVIVLNPYVKFPVGHFKPFVGGTIPVFGHLWTDAAFGVNGGLIAEF